MGANTKIEWTDHSWNPWIGCQKVSPGCQYCYAERDFARKPHWANTWGPPETSQRIKTSQANWYKPLTWNKWAETAGRRDKVFCASLCDVFEDNPQVKEWRLELWNLIEQTPNLDWLLLTKRPENIEEMIPGRWQPWGRADGGRGRLPANIWLGISAETQDELVSRWCVLDSIAHRVYPQILFVSLEPLLGPIDLEVCLSEADIGDEEHSWWTHAVDWVIAGGESGPLARPMHPDWVRAIRAQCIEAGVPFFFKQWGAWIGKAEISNLTDDGWKIKSDWLSVIRGCPWGCLSIDGKYRPETTTWNGRQNDPQDDYEVIIYKVGKKATGRLLDGREWNQMPICDKS